jgi:hypothetical protein
LAAAEKAGAQANRARHESKTIGAGDAPAVSVFIEIYLSLNGEAEVDKKVCGGSPQDGGYAGERERRAGALPIARL